MNEQNHLHESFPTWKQLQIDVRVSKKIESLSRGVVPADDVTSFSVRTTNVSDGKVDNCPTFAIELQNTSSTIAQSVKVIQLLPDNALFDEVASANLLGVEKLSEIKLWDVVTSEKIEVELGDLQAGERITIPFVLRPSSNEVGGNVLLPGATVLMSNAGEDGFSSNNTVFKIEGIGQTLPSNQSRESQTIHTSDVSVTARTKCVQMENNVRRATVNVEIKNSSEQPLRFARVFVRIPDGATWDRNDFADTNGVEKLCKQSRWSHSPTIREALQRRALPSGTILRSVIRRLDAGKQLSLCITFRFANESQPSFEFLVETKTSTGTTIDRQPFYFELVPDH